MKNKFLCLLTIIMFLVIMFPKEITFPLFPEISDFSEPLVVIITPCSRPENLEKIKESIDLSKIKRWYISYDCQNDKMKFIERFPSEPKIKELKCVRPSITGNGPRNEALDEIAKSEGKCLVCFMDDDNIIHPEFLNKDFKLDKIYTYDIYRWGAPQPGNVLKAGDIDTAQYLVDIDIIGDLRWGKPGEAESGQTKDAADGDFITTLVNGHADKWEYIPETLAYYNFLNK